MSFAPPKKDEKGNHEGHEGKSKTALAKGVQIHFSGEDTKLTKARTEASHASARGTPWAVLRGLRVIFVPFVVNLFRQISAASLVF